MSAAIARWKDLCVDASDARVVTGFWGPVLGLAPEYLDGGDAVLRGGPPGRTVWVNVVPEPKVVKNRVHLDLVADDVPAMVRRLRELGATPVAGFDGDRQWQVLADPEGNELCLFPAATGGRREPTALVVDAARPVELAAWWAEILGARRLEEPEGPPRWLVDVPGLPWDAWKFVEVPDPRSVKNRWHWDVVTEDVDALVARGASVLRSPEPDWQVMADPEGNVFCAFAP